MDDSSSDESAEEGGSGHEYKNYQERGSNRHDDN
jgi:hypothetical protein